MKIISALIDFTQTSKVATQYAVWLAKKENASVNLLHITSSNSANSGDIEEKLLDFTRLKETGLPYTVSVGDGSHLVQIPKLLELSDSDFVVIGTHGEKDIFQTLFGANVVKLIQSIHTSALVVQDHSPAPEKGFPKILFPMAPHDNFELKINETARWALLFDSMVEIFCLSKPGGTLDKAIASNLDMTQRIFSEQKVRFELIMRESQVYSVGYAREILDQAKAQQVELLSIMSQSSKENSYFGNVDKTNMILNPMGIPVLCVGA